MIGLVDGNNFFVSCERIFDKSLEGQAVAVLSNNDGCVVSRSYEFKSLDIPMGTPMFKLKPIIKRYNLKLRSTNHDLYANISNRVMQVLAQFAPEVEQYSIDEAFIYPKLELGKSYFDYGKNLRSTILKWVGIPCGVGFAPTKTLAKIANHIAKKSKDGVFVLPKNYNDILDKLPVGEVWGIGRNRTESLTNRGIRTALQLANYGDDKLRRMFSISLARIAMELRGIECLKDEDDESLSQSISCSRCFGSPVTEFEDIAESVATYIGRAAEKLRKEGQRASGVQIYYVYYPEYEPNKLDGGISSTTVNFKYPTDDTLQMIREVKPHLARIFIKGRRYKKSGICFFGLESGAVQLDLFASQGNVNSKSKLFETVDKINAKFGKGSLIPLAEGLTKKWQMRKNMMSPCYTTSWNDIPVVK